MLFYYSHFCIISIHSFLPTIVHIGKA